MRDNQLGDGAKLPTEAVKSGWFRIFEDMARVLGLTCLATDEEYRASVSKLSSPETR